MGYDAHLLPAFVEGRIGIVESVRGEDVTHVVNSFSLTFAHSHQAVGADGGIGSRDVKMDRRVRVRASLWSDDDIVKVDSGCSAPHVPHG